MERKIKFIWDFKGPEALQIAKHHEVHLKEFIEKKAPEFQITGVETINPMHSLAYWVIDESKIMTYRDLLKPHRATVYTEN